MATVTTVSIICFVFGAIIGSFLSVCAYRIPMGKYTPEREGIKVLEQPVSITSPARSICPHCEHQLAWWHNIPLFSWLILRGRCAFCQARIPFRYFLIEVATGCLCGLCYWKFGLTLSGFVAFVFLCALVVITFIDIDYMIIPNVITYPGTIIGVILVLINEFASAPGTALLDRPFVASSYEAVMGLLAGPGVLLAIWWFYLKVRKRDGLGLGDVKLLAMIGVLFGWEASWLTIFVGSLVGSIFGIIQVLGRKMGLSHPLPFGPYLVAGFLFFLFDGPIVLGQLLGNIHDPLDWWVNQKR
jgi:leader peptidase (prepilin peptidase)/N-methyltransferase